MYELIIKNIVQEYLCWSKYHSLTKSGGTMVETRENNNKIKKESNNNIPTNSMVRNTRICIIMVPPTFPCFASLHKKYIHTTLQNISEMKERDGMQRNKTVPYFETFHTFFIFFFHVWEVIILHTKEKPDRLLENKVDKNCWI